MPAFVQIRRAVKFFGEKRALSYLDLDVREGEALGLLGPNGAGKSTTMSIIAGLLSLDEGSVCLFGDRSPRDPATRAQVGFAPQSLALYPELTAVENLAFFGRLYGLSGKTLAAGIVRALALAELEERGADRVGTFSGGMLRRLNLAGAVVHSPKLLLLDEPTAGVDPQSRAHLLAALERLRDEGLTIIYSSHYMEEVEHFCSRVAIIDGGRVVAVGTSPELTAEYGGEQQVVLTGPTLESAFMALTGHSLRDDV